MLAMLNESQHTDEGPEGPEPEGSAGVDALIWRGLKARAEGDGTRALALLRRAASVSQGRPEPWYWMGRLQEDAQDRVGAAYAYFLAHDLARYEPATRALRRLGYLD